MHSDLIQKYFTNLSRLQNDRFELLYVLYNEWNQKINVISRKDIEHLYERHILHSLSIAKVIQFVPGTKILDVGTGGGFPGVPLAVMFPEVGFHLIDSIGKKIKVVEAVVKELGLENVTFEQVRAENVEGRYDFVVSRAVTSLPVFHNWIKSKVGSISRNSLKNGVLYLKGGDISEEISKLKRKTVIIPLASIFEEPFFETKKLVYFRV